MRMWFSAARTSIYRIKRINEAKKKELDIFCGKRHPELKIYENNL